MDDNRIFAWDNYDDNPLDAIGVNTIPTQKEATYAPAAEGELVTDAFDTFMSNGDEYAYPQLAEVAGEKPKVLMFGEGFVAVESEGDGGSDDDEQTKTAITITAKSGTYTETSEVPTAGDITSDFEDYVTITGKLASGDAITKVTLTVTGSEGTYTVTPSAAEIGANTGNYEITYENGTWTHSA